MKELSIEEKARAYDEALKAAFVAHKDEDRHLKATLERIFPELAESDDERIRKEIIEYIKIGTYHKDWIAWLEKQGEQKPQGKSALEAANEEKVDNQNCVKPTDKIEPIEWSGKINSRNAKGVLKEMLDKKLKSDDKIEPKFKVGDWISGYYTNYKVLSVNNEGYVVEDVDGNKINILFENEKFHYLWTIQEARDGEVLIDKSNNRECLFIFKETKPSNIKTECFNPLTVLGYCGIGGAGFTKGSGWGDTANCTYYPATKEQRNSLFAKMKEAGYEWDAEKKELKKVEQNPAWSEEDEKMLDFAIRAVGLCKQYAISHQVNGYSQLPDVPKRYEELQNWLKSLKDRVQPKPKQEWKQENTGDLTDFENAMMHIGGSFFGQHGGLDPNDTNAIKEQAKLLLELTPKQEWSEEDEKNLLEISCLIGNYRTGDDEYKLESWLESLKDRVQPQSTWSEEDEKIYQSIMDDTVQENQLDYKQTNWLRDIKYRYFPQPKQKWSEEDEKMLNLIIAVFEVNHPNEYFKANELNDPNMRTVYTEEIVTWLKSLRPQNKWKPSDEQMNDLKIAIDSFPYETDYLQELYEDLKKLKEE